MNKKSSSFRISPLLYFISIYLLLLSIIISSEEVNSRKTEGKEIIKKVLLVEDIRQLANILETTHPQPYFKGGGRVAFHRRVHEIIR